ncbi:hypothetical protein TRVA0_025S01684 [Trichomonascus vanleenenianus]|uniref:thioredoxin domain-containing protein n=1 Tax=Trichomonascus vanleenenianus TaxID=2268995 RepID=UPI003ECACB01
MWRRITRRMYSTLENRLASASSPYLRAHQTNPVAWQQWTEETLQRATKEQKPVFLSIGYHTCHWCHVMNKESFSDQRIADILNKNFIPIKVDREERPDVDAVYMMFLQATTGQGGWPLNVFLVPDTLEPIFGGTYWAGPQVAKEHQRGAFFEDVLKGVQEVWQNDRDKCRKSASSIADQLRQLVKAQSEPESAEFTHGLLEDVAEHFTTTFDPVNGGFAHAPKFAMAHNLSFFLKFHKRFKDKEALAHKAAFTLLKMGQGGIKDQIGHGFSRYSVTEDWNLPHFEKMLYDQALLLEAYLDAFLADKARNGFAEYYAADIVQFLRTGLLSSPTGGFFSAVDADSVNASGHHSEGAYYVWTAKELNDVIKHNTSKFGVADMAAMFWGVHDKGNVDAQFDVHHELVLQNVLHEASTVAEVAKAFGKPESEVVEAIDNARKWLLAYREQNRTPPEVDNKIVTAWNGLAIGALARAGTVLQDSEALDAAVKAAQFIRENCYDSKTKSLRRIAGANTNGMNEDYAYLIQGLLNLYEATFDTEYLGWARDLQDTQVRLFWDSQSGGFFSVEEENATELIFRPKVGFDSAEPSPNGVSATNLFRLFSMLGDMKYEIKAQGVLNCYGKDLAAQPFGYLSMMGPVLAELDGMGSLILVGDESKGGSEINELIRSNPMPNITIVQLNPQSIEFFKGLENTVYEGLFKQHGDGPLQAFLCKDRACRLFNGDYSEIL